METPPMRVKKDVDLWVPKLNPNAPVVMHDIGWAEGILRVVMEDISPIAKCEGRLPKPILGTDLTSCFLKW